MNVSRFKKIIFRIIGVTLILIFIFLTYQWYDGEAIETNFIKLFTSPLWLALMICSYVLSFILKAMAWQIYLNQRRVTWVCLTAILYSLFVNHLSPIKIGDIVRTGFIAKRTSIPLHECIQSVVVMRVLDMFVLGMFSVWGALYLGFQLSYDQLWMLGAGSVILLCLLYVLRTSIKKSKFAFMYHQFHSMRGILVSRKGIMILMLTAISWILEAAVIYGVANSLQLSHSFIDLLWANSMTIAGQVFHFTPGGIGTYESTMSFALNHVGYSWKDAYLAAVLSHTFKFIFSYVVGIILLIIQPIQWSEFLQWKSMKGVKKS